MVPHPDFNEPPHLPIMVDEVLSFFSSHLMKVFFDGTLGAGGHTEAILSCHPEIETVIGCDRDASALEIARNRISSPKVQFVHANFANLDEILVSRGISSVDGFFLTWESLLCS